MTTSPRKRPRVLTPPRSGWASLLLLLLLQLIVGLSISAAQWTALTRQDQSPTGFAPVLLVASGLIGFLLARSGLGIVRSHIVGATVGALVILAGVGMALLEDRGSPTGMGPILDAIAADVAGGRVSQAQSGFTVLLVLAAFCWTTGQFSSFALFRHERVGPGLVALGTVLAINIAATQSVEPGEQYVSIVCFSLVAMALLVRVNLAHQRLGWARRQVADSGDVSRAFVRSGAMFVAIAVAGAVSLSSLVVAAPLEKAWDGADDALEQLTRILGDIGISTPPRRDPQLFPPEAPIADRWDQSATLMFVATADIEGQYWRAVAYDRFLGSEWLVSVTDNGYPVATGDSLLASSWEGRDVASSKRRAASFAIEARYPLGATLLAPEGADELDRDASVGTLGPGGPISETRFDQRIDVGGRYEVVSLVHQEGQEAGGLTQYRLAEAQSAYPEDVSAWYLDIQEGSIGPRTRAEAQRIRDQLAPELRDPYHIAAEIESWFRDSGQFEYSVNVEGMCAPGESRTECLLKVGNRRGFCQHFASAMVMMLRHLRIPARYVMGFLPGVLATDAPQLRYEVQKRALHAWVEVYFPGYGWVRFDPTPGIEEGLGQDTQALPVGRPRADGPDPGRTPGPGDLPTPEPTQPPPSVEPSPTPLTGTVIGGSAAGDAMLLAVVGVVLAVLLILVLVTWRIRRLPAPESELAYRGVVSLATRLGHGPNPSQTSYEYMAGLAEVVPAAREDLDLVAQVRVEAAYGRHAAEGPRLASLRRAYVRARVALLRLLFRRRS